METLAAAVSTGGGGYIGVDPRRLFVVVLDGLQIDARLLVLFSGSFGAGEAVVSTRDLELIIVAALQLAGHVSQQESNFGGGEVAVARLLAASFNDQHDVSVQQEQ